jgi:hypothetical protein
LQLARALHSAVGAHVPDRQRVILALGNRQEAGVVGDWLDADGYEAVQCPSVMAAVAEMRARPFDLLIADAGKDGRPAARAQGLIRRPLTPTILLGDTPPPKSDIVTSPTMYVARPIDRALLGCYVSMAMLEGGPVRRSPRKLVSPFEAVVNGIPSRILDVSVEGVRIEMLPGLRSVLPPYFTVRVPLVGVGVSMQRIWARGSTASTAALMCGAALAANRASAVQGWRSFVETIPAASADKTSL